MGFLDWAALIIGAGLVLSGVRAIRRRQANVPERYEGGKVDYQKFCLKGQSINSLYAKLSVLGTLSPSHFGFIPGRSHVK